MSVLLSLLTWVPGTMGGSETYVEELLRELQDAPIDIATAVAPIAAGRSGRLPETVVQEFPNGEPLLTRVRAAASAVRHRDRLRQLAGSADVVHTPFTVPVLPRVDGGARVVSLLDVQHHDLPRMFSRGERLYRAAAYDRPARGADAVITISEFTRLRAVHQLGLDPARVHVAHLGVRAGEHLPHLGLREPFLLYPAKGWKHKNHAVLLEGFALLRAQQPSLRLILTGATVDELPALPRGVDVRGRVGRAELLGLYRSASVLVFPSLYEGFGLPPLEAMASGCPVAAARSGALPEVVGDAAVLFDAEDPIALAAAVEEALDRAPELQAAGLERAARFTWRRCADVHLSVYAALGA